MQEHCFTFVEVMACPLTVELHFELSHCDVTWKDMQVYKNLSTTFVAFINLIGAT